MPMLSRALVGAFTLVVATTASAQEPTSGPPAPSAPLIVGNTAAPMLRIGSEVALRTLVELTTLKKGLAVGQRVPLEVAESVMVNGQVVIPVGTPAMGEITSVRNKGMWGKSGAFADASSMFASAIVRSGCPALSTTRAMRGAARPWPLRRSSSCPPASS